MNIIILNRFEIENTKFDSSFIIISVIDYVECIPNVREKNCKGILKILVWDTEDSVKNINKFNAVEIPKDKIFSKKISFGIIHRSCLPARINTYHLDSFFIAFQSLKKQK